MLLGIALVLTATLLWAVLDKIPTFASGRGVFLHDAPLQELVVPISPGGDGIVENINVSVDQTVKQGDVLLTLRLPDLDQQIISAGQSLSGLHADFGRLSNHLAEQRSSEETLESDRRAAIKETVTLLSSQRDELQAVLQGQKGLLASGNATRSNVLTVRQRYEQILIDLSKQRTELLAIDARLTDAQERQFTQLSDAKRRLDEQQRELTALVQRRERLRTVTSPKPGFVNSILTSDGHNVGSRDVVLTLSTGSKKLDVIGFVDAQRATRIRLGMTAYVVPSTVKKAEYGSLLGRISYISQTPISAAEIDAMLSDRQMTEFFTQTGPVFLVRIEALADRETPSGFAWTSKRGPPFTVEPGTLAEVQVVTKEQAPITLVMPALRELAGVH